MQTTGKLAFFFILTLVFQTGGLLAGPVLTWEEKSWNFGKVPDDSIVEHTFYFTNTGTEPLYLTSIRPSCGCTAVQEEDTLGVAPGKRSSLKVNVNMNGKRGPILKTVRIKTNEPGNNVHILRLTAEVIPAAEFAMMNPHKGQESVMKKILEQGGSLFEGECRKCHFEPAGNKTGKELYDAVCAMCHGNGEHPKIPAAPDIRAMNWKNMFVRGVMSRKIRKGAASPMMPAFSRKKGGPLDDEQIRSLVKYFRDLSREH